MKPWDELTDIGVTLATGGGVNITCQFADGSLPSYQIIRVPDKFVYKLLFKLVTKQAILRNPVEAHAASSLKTE